jgi:ketosteroid isomerase-like protein
LRSFAPVTDAAEVLTRFWDIQDAGDYQRLAELFAPDAELVDPMFGTFRGAEIPAFFERMNHEIAQMGVRFRLVELAGSGDVAWVRWEAISSTGTRSGVGLYRTRDGLITFYQDVIERSHPSRSTES